MTRRFVGSRRGYPIAGLLGGIVSSTNVTFLFARASRDELASCTPLALGVAGASAVMCVRVLVATAVLNPAAARVLLPYLIGPFLAAALVAWWGIRKYKEPALNEPAPSNPLQFASALQMAILFQVVLFVVSWAQGTWGQAGVFLSAGVLGLTDVDALVVSLAKNAGSQLPIAMAARAIAIGVLTNTLLKLSIGALIGAEGFRRTAVLGLSAVAIACVISIVGLTET